MHTQAREIRHTVLLLLIVVVVPLIFYPSDLGLKLGASVAIYVLAELLYFGLVAAVFLDFPGVKASVTASVICLGFRLGAGIAFGILLLLMDGVEPVTAIGAGLWAYKPAVLLQSLTTPFITLSVLRSILGQHDEKKVSRLTVTPPARAKKTPIRSRTGQGSKPQPTIIISQAQPPTSDTAVGDFEAAMRHVCALSAVKFCVLFDEEGLPVAFAGDEPALRDIWAPIGCLLSEQIQTSLARVGDLVLEGFHLTLDAYRLHMASVCDMWFLVGADRNSEELEKVRMGQAVEMIKRTFHQRYVEIQPPVVAEESHV